MPQTTDIVKVIIAGTSLLLFFSAIIISFVLAYRKKYRKDKEEKEKRETLFRQELLQTQLEIQEQTLKTISQEIHDNIGQTLSLARQTLNSMDVDRIASFDRIHQSEALVGKAIHELRSLSKTLDTENILEAGLQNAIDFELAQLARAGFRTELKTSGIPYDIDPRKELILFRVIQEAIHNIIKHARASQVLISIAYGEDSLHLCIEDNGRGFDMAASPATLASGSGLRNMRGRIDLLRGDMLVQSSTAGGTRLQITIPNVTL